MPSIKLYFGGPPYVLQASRGLFSLEAPAAYGELGSGGSTPSLNSVGINMAQLTYFGVDQPLLNVMKMANTASAYGYSGLNGPWLTSSSTQTHTGEEPYLVLDSDSWPTSLVAGNGFSGSQKFTSVQTWIFSQFSGTPPTGASEWYPGGAGVTYQAELTGAGTLSFTGTSNLTVITGNSYVTASGTQLVSTLPSGQSATVTFNMNASSGLQIQITALPSNTNYIKIPYIVDSRYVNNYLAGQICHPYFKAAMNGNGGGAISVMRMMTALSTPAQEWPVTFTGPLAQNATSGTISSIGSGSWQGSFTTWPFNTGSYKIVFATGQVATLSATYGSASITWNTALSAAIPNSSVQAYMSPQSGWSARPLLSNAAWSNIGGYPAEAYISMANELGINCWTNLPCAAYYIDSQLNGTGYFATQLAKLFNNGTGANIANSNLSSFSGLNTALTAYIELSNEVWNLNGNYQEAQFCIMMGIAAGFSVPQGIYQGAIEWYGTQVAGIGDAFYSVFGGSPRALVSMMSQFGGANSNGTAYMQIAMNTPDWTSRAYTHHIGAYGCAPYVGPGGYNGTLNATDAQTICDLANPVTELFSLVYSNKGASGNTYASVPITGWVGSQTTTLQQYIAYLVAQGNSWASALPVVCYEGGADLGNYSGYSGLQTYLTEMLTDARLAYVAFDPSNQLSSGPGYLPSLVSAGASFVNFLGITGTQWPMMECITQMASTPPYTNMPMYQGVLSYAQAG